MFPATWVRLSNYWGNQRQIHRMTLERQMCVCSCHLLLISSVERPVPLQPKSWSIEMTWDGNHSGFFLHRRVSWSRRAAVICGFELSLLSSISSRSPLASLQRRSFKLFRLVVFFEFEEIRSEFLFRIIFVSFVSFVPHFRSSVSIFPIFPICFPLFQNICLNFCYDSECKIFWIPPSVCCLLCFFSYGKNHCLQFFVVKNLLEMFDLFRSILFNI